MEKRHIHIVGICGVATSAIAIAFKKKGWKVTGSDKGIFPPVSTELEKNNVDFYTGWHPEKIGNPELIMFGGNGTSPNNPEILHAEEKNIPYYSFPEILEKYFIKKNSIVVTGTWGKTTISSLLSFILLKSGINPSYFSGGLSLSHDTGELTESDWSIVEGDEYQVSISDKRPKWVYYHPTHLILTSVSWDHADLYPTEEKYFETFKDLIEKIEDRNLVICDDDKGIKKIIGDKKAISYGKESGANYQYHSIEQTKDGLKFSIRFGDKEYEVKTPMIGRFNAENITAAFAMAHMIGISPEIIIKNIENFKGIKRRFEKRLDGNITVFDCHAPTAEKAKSILESLAEIYNKKIIAIFEPNIGGRQRNSAHVYENAFVKASEVIIPRLTKLKVGEGEKPLEGDELAEIIKKTNSKVNYFDNDQKIIDYVKEISSQGDIVVFLGSHGFRNMIEEVVEKLK